MSAAATIERAAAGELPAWACVTTRRRAHIARVASLMERWGRELELPPAELRRWLAAAWLHDALRDADPAELRQQLTGTLADLPASVLHGPAAARRLGDEGIDDGELLDAVAYHTLGYEGFHRLGRALYAADFLEPGRTFAPVLCAELRARMPGSMAAVVKEIVAARLAHLVRRGHAIRPETVGFWNALAGAREVDARAREIDVGAREPGAGA